MAYLVRKNPKLSGSLLLGADKDAFRVAQGAAAGSVFEFTLCRNAIYHAADALGLKAGDRVLVPAYHCDTAIEPLVQSGVEVDFYRVRRDCTVDVADVRARIQDGTRALLAIHYFGFPQPVAPLRELCDSTNLFFIEDCAHVLAGRSGSYVMGRAGDVSVFSWRKFLPIYDGGHLVVNNPTVGAPAACESPAWVFNLKAAKNTFGRLGTDADSRLGRIVERCLGAPARLLKRAAPARVAAEAISRGSTFKQEFDRSSVRLPMSAVSRRIIARSNIPAIIAARRSNYRSLEVGIRSIRDVAPLFPELPEGASPWAFPVDGSRIPGLNSLLRAAGIPSFTWEAVVHPRLVEGEHPDADLLYRNVVMLPLHQDLERADLERILDIVRSVASDRPEGLPEPPMRSHR